MSNHDDDNNLEEYLSGDSEISKLYNESTDADMLDIPGMDLDSSILAAAKREVLAGPQKSKKSYSPFSNNYLIPLSTAASMLIVVAVVSFFPNEQVVEQSFDLSEDDMEIASIISEQQVVKLHEQETAEIAEAKSRSYSAKLNDPVAKSKKKTARKASDKATEKTIKLHLLDKRVTSKKEKQQSKELKLAKLKKRQDVLEMKKLTTSTIVVHKDDQQRTTEVEVLSQNQDSSIEARSPPSSPAPEQTGLFAALAVTKIKYNEEQWNKFTESEWLTNIRKIHHQQGDKAVEKIIVRFKKKFPTSKINFKQFLSDSNKE